MKASPPIILCVFLVSCMSSQPEIPRSEISPVPSLHQTESPDREDPTPISEPITQVETIENSSVDLEIEPIPVEPFAFALSDMGTPRFGLLQSFPGFTSFDPNKPTASIAAGPDRIVVFHDNGAEIRDKRGEVLSRSNMVELFQMEYTDPRAVYDWVDDRFILLGWGYIPLSTCQPGECVANIYLAVSRDSSPDSFSEEDWMWYWLDGTMMDGQPQTIFPDWTMLGFDDENIVITAHSITFESAYENNLNHVNIGDRIWVIDRDDLGNEHQITKWVEFAHPVDPLVSTPDPNAGFAPFNLFPALHLTSDGTFFLASQAEWNCGITIWGLDNEDNLETAIATSSGVCAGSSNIKQPGDFPDIYHGNSPKIITPPINVNGSLWVIHYIKSGTTANPGSAIRWLEIDVSDWPNNVHIKQEGVIEEPNTWLIFPTMIVNQDGDMMILYAKSSATVYPSLFYTGRLSTDPPNTTRPEAVLKMGVTGLGMLNPFHQKVDYGAYFGISLDPVDGTVWMIGEYGGFENRHVFWIGQVGWETILPNEPDFSVPEDLVSELEFEILSAELISRNDSNYSGYLQDGINVKVLLRNLDPGFIPPEELAPPVFCGECSGWENVGYENGGNVIIVHFQSMPPGKLVQITAFGYTATAVIGASP